jgi:cobalt/nickel transport system permease protein
MTAVLVVQALLFQDGGITALGANVLNMGVLPCLLGFVVYRLLRRLLAGTRGALASAFLTAWLLVVLSASLASAQIALSGTIPLRLVLPAMTGVHALIGIGEGLITAAALAFLLRVRKDLVHPLCQPHLRPAGGAT